MSIARSKVYYKKYPQKSQNFSDLHKDTYNYSQKWPAAGIIIIPDVDKFVFMKNPILRH